LSIFSKKNLSFSEKDFFKKFSKNFFSKFDFQKITSENIFFSKHNFKSFFGKIFSPQKKKLKEISLAFQSHSFFTIKYQ